MSNVSSLQEILQNFIANGPSIQAATLIRLDGLRLTSAAPSGDRLSEIAEVMSSVILSLRNQMGSEFTQEDIEQIIFKKSRGYIIASSCGSAMLFILARKDINLEVLSTEVKEITKEIISILSPAIILSSKLSFPTDT